MHPVGPRSAGVYWFRRVVVAVVVLAVVVAIGWWVMNRGSGSKIDPAASTVTTTSHLTGVLAAETSTEDSVLGDEDSSAADSSGTGTTPRTTGTSTAATTPTSSAATSGTVSKTTAATSTGKTGTKAAAQTTAQTTAKSTAKAPATTKAASKTTAPKTATSKTAAPKTTSPPKPSYDANGNLICAASAITVKATTQGTVFPAGAQPRLGMTVTNASRDTCVRDVSGTLQVYTVYTAAGARVWSTADCVPGEGHEVRQLAPGASASFLIIWSGKTSNPGCTATRVRVKAGEYKLVASLGTLSSKPVTFTMR